MLRSSRRPRRAGRDSPASGRIAERQRAATVSLECLRLGVTSFGGPLAGEPAEIAEELSAYRGEGISHVQVSIDRISTGALERFAPALELVRKGA